MEEPLYYARVKVAGSANAETLQEIITSTEEEPKTVVSLNLVEVTATENNDAKIAAYIEREQIVDVDIKQFLNVHDAATSQWRNRTIPLGHRLPVGQGLKVGHSSGATASDIEFVAVYTIGK